MAQRTLVVLTDDLDGGDADETVQFTLDGVAYEIDLSEGNANGLRGSLAPYVKGGRRTGGTSKRRDRPTAASNGKPSRTANAALTEIRTWARENGYKVSDRGRMSANIKAAYEAAHG